MLELKAKKREVGTSNVQALREEGSVPAVYYGPKTPSTPIAIDEKDFLKVWREAGETTVVTIQNEDGKGVEALIHEASFHPVTGKPLHVDLYVMEKGKPVEVSVPLEFTGESPAVKTMGGILVKVLHEIEIEVLPAKIPHELTVDISALVDFESKILAKDISLPEGAVLLTGEEETVAAVAEQKEEEEAAAEVDLSAIEVEKRGKAEEEN